MGDMAGPEGWTGEAVWPTAPVGIEDFEIAGCCKGEDG